MNLKKRIINAGSWTLIGHFASQAIRLLSNLIMTRLLMPEMFGIMAIANIIIVGLVMFADLGLRQNIIQSKRGDDPLFLNTVWMVNIIRGVVLSIFCLLAAYLLTILNDIQLIEQDNVYASSLLPQVLIVLALSPLIRGFESTKVATANRGLELKKIVLLELIAQLCGLLFMLVWVSIDRSIWALVYGALVACSAKVILGHTSISGHKNRFMWDSDAFNEIFHFGKWVLLSSILGFLINQGDKLILGGLMPASTFGLFTIAALLYSSMQALITKLINIVVFPALGEVYRKNSERICEKYYQIRLPIDVFCLFSAGFLFVFGSKIVEILYDQRYLESGYMLQILSLIFIELRYSVVGQFFLVIGKPKLLSLLTFLRLISMVFFILIGHSLYGDIGAVWGLVISYLPSIFITLYFKGRYNLLNIKKEFLCLPIFFLGAVIGAGGLLLS